MSFICLHVIGKIPISTPTVIPTVKVAYPCVSLQEPGEEAVHTVLASAVGGLGVWLLCAASRVPTGCVQHTGEALANKQLRH